MLLGPIIPVIEHANLIGFLFSDVFDELSWKQWSTLRLNDAEIMFFFIEEDYSFEMWLTEIRQASKL